jgi:methionyl-tRNA formyltransferase
MRVVVAGSRWFGAEVLTAVREAGHNVIGAAAPSGGDQLALIAKRRDIPLSIHGERIESGDIADGADIILSAHCHAFITEAARNKAKFGAIGYHPSLLPLHRGREAIRWAIRMREAITGGTIYYLDDGADTGDIALQEWCFIRKDDTPRTLWERELVPIGVKLFLRVLGEIENEIINRKAQDQSLATFEPAFCKRSLQ